LTFGRKSSLNKPQTVDYKNFIIIYTKAKGTAILTELYVGQNSFNYTFAPRSTKCL